MLAEMSLSRDAIDLVNRRAYSSRTATKFYDRAPTLFEAERVVFEELAPHITNRKLLDIGIGGGRTTPFLLKISSDYTGIDYSPVLIERARCKFQLEALYVCDVRDMSRFADSTFDFTLFSFNGLDSVSHGDRLKALLEIHRVLKPNGFFAFSTHNREWKNAGKPLWGWKNRHWTLRFIKGCILALLYQPRHWWRRRFETIEKEYAIINDGGLRYSVLNYYISALCQVAQLHDIGFSDARVYDMEGRIVTNDTQSPWLYYVARKAQTSA